MGWENISSESDLIVFERKNKGYTTRIEARNEQKKWLIYNIFFNTNGLNLSEEFEARTKEEASKIVTILQQQPTVTLSSLKKQMLERKKSIQIKINRAYKEYNVEKWFFRINSERVVNFVTLRFYDNIDLDFVINDKYKPHEQRILKSIITTLGLNNVEEGLNINCYYFNKHTKKKIESSTKNMLFGKVEFDANSSE
jgi:hypothetical protein